MLGKMGRFKEIILLLILVVAVTPAAFILMPLLVLAIVVGAASYELVRSVKYKKEHHVS